MTNWMKNIELVEPFAHMIINQPSVSLGRFL